MLGTYPNSHSTKEYSKVEVSQTPASFDAREQWPNFIHPVRDQQQCGSCWAFGATEALSDRFAIASNGQFNVILSPEDMVSCDKSNYGCSGGHLDAAWDYLEKYGVVSETCFPYAAGNGLAPVCIDGICMDAKTEVYKKYKCAKNS